ncbi:MAG TPA: MFS transporter [Dehalococcoidia bacterium]|nr:MFS transporter [Dehalococcoidia bacterium]
MTTQAIAAGPETFVEARKATLTGRLSAPAELLSIPGFLQLGLSNALSQSFAMRMQGLAVAWVVLEMTGSQMWLGIVNGVPAISVVLFSLLGGVLADSRDARRVLIAVRSGLGAAAFLALVLISTGQIRIEHLLIYGLLAVGLSAIDLPVGRTLMLQMVGPERLMNANAMQNFGMNLVNIAAPTSMAILIGVAGSGAAFGVLGAGYVLGTLTLLKARLSVTPIAPAAPRRSQPVEELIAGLVYVRSTPRVAALVSLGFLMPFAGVYFAMIPTFARDVLSAGAGGLGLMVAAFSLGSLAGSMLLVMSQGIRRRGGKVAVLGILFGAGMIGFAVSESLLLSSAISLSMGFIAAFWQNMVTTMVQTVAAPEMRGRTLSVFTMGFQLASLGWLIGGVTASLAGPEAAVAIAGICFAGFSTLIFTVSKEAREVD